MNFGNLLKLPHQIFDEIYSMIVPMTINTSIKNDKLVLTVYMEFMGGGAAILGLLGMGILGCCSSDQQQQQQITVSGDSESKPKRICPDCGMENPREANHCGDCGFSFKTSDQANGE